MQLTQSLAHTIESVYRRLDYEQPLRRRLDLALPAIYRFNLGSDVDACRQLPVNQRMRDAAGFIERTASRKNEPFVGHIGSVVIRLKLRVSLEAYEAGDGNANQVWHFWMASRDGRRVHVCERQPGRARHRALRGIAAVEWSKSHYWPRSALSGRIFLRHGRRHLIIPRHYAAGHCGTRAYTHHFLCRNPVESRRRHQLHRLAQSARIQRY